MARCKSSPEVVRAKNELAHRLREIRTEQYGERGGPELARRLNLPIRTWYNYETGVTVPSEVLLRFIELTGVEPAWLLHGRDAKYRRRRPSACVEDRPVAPGSVGDLLRRALSLLDAEDDRDGPGDPGVILPEADDPGSDPDAHRVVVRVEEPDDEPGGPGTLVSLPLQREWLGPSRRFRAVRVRGDAMAPQLADGAIVGVSERPEAPEALDGALVAVRIDEQLVVRRLQVAGRVALLRAEDPKVEPEVIPVVPTDDDDDPPAFRRVLWAYTPHGTAPGAATLP